MKGTQSSYLDCKHKHMLENGAPPDKFGVLINVFGLSHFKGTHTVYFSRSRNIINIIPRTYFHCITIRVASSSG